MSHDGMYGSQDPVPEQHVKYLPTPTIPVDTTIDPKDHTPRGMIFSLREIGNCLGVGVTENTSDHDLTQLVRVSRLACLLSERNPQRDHITLRIAEVGSWCGESMLAIARGIKLHKDTILSDACECNVRFPAVEVHCIDTWEGSPSDNSSAAVGLYGGSIHKFFELAATQAEWVDDYLEVVGHVTPSAEGCQLFSDNCFDFIYLDAGHDYASIKQDIDCWYPKLKPGGVFAGHDYSSQFPGVPLAVDDLCQKLGVAPLIPLGSHIWVLVKPQQADESPS